VSGKRDTSLDWDKGLELEPTEVALGAAAPALGPAASGAAAGPRGATIDGRYGGRCLNDAALPLQIRRNERQHGWGRRSQSQAGGAG
jgi:hypothetical protein